MGWRQIKTEQEEGGWMKRDIVRRLVKRKQRRDGRLKENSVSVYIRGRQHRDTQRFNTERNDRAALSIPLTQRCCVTTSILYQAFIAGR